MARRKQNPIKDIGNQVGSWLGGAARVYADITDSSRDNQPGRLPQVQAALNATRAIGKVVDTAAGGFGSALVSDARRMARTGSSTPSALYKTAAVNLAAGAAGVGAAKVVGKVVSAGKSRFREVGVHFSDVPDLSRITYSQKRAGTGLGRKTIKGKTYKFTPTIGDDMEPPFTPRELAQYASKEHAHLAKASGRPPKSIGYITKSRRGEIDPAYGPWHAARTVRSQTVVDRVQLPTTPNAEEEVAKRLYSALSRSEQKTAMNTRAAKNLVGGAIGGAIQQTGIRKTRGGGKNRK